MSLSQYILDAKEQYRLQVRERSTILTRARWYYVSVLGLVTIVASTITNDNRGNNVRFALSLSAVGLLVNLLLWALTKLPDKRLGFYQVVAGTQVVLDICLASLIINYQGGLASRGTVLYAIPIAGAGLLFSNVFAYITAILSGVAYVITIGLYQLYHPGAYQARMIILPTIFYTAVFIIIAYVISAFADKTKEKEREQSYTELLSLLRHQLYHPSGVIAAIIDMMQHGEHYPKWPPGDKVYLQQMKRENKKMHTMITNALESISEKQEELKNVKVFDIIPILNDEAASSASGAKRIADLKTMLPNKSVEVEGNQAQLTTAIDNIIGNAFRYTEKGTAVIISASEEGNKVTISIHDKGKGIKETEQQELFKLFSKLESRITKDPEKLYDSGLGLYVSKMIVERHKGTLELSSSSDYGTNITITLNKRLL